MEILILILLAAAGIGILVIIAKIFATPLRWALKLLVNTLFGFIALALFNFLGGFVGLSLGINWINAIITGVLGVPGVALLLLIKYLI